jgi:hypothetical protein
MNFEDEIKTESQDKATFDTGVNEQSITKQDILEGLTLIGERLTEKGIEGEMIIAGGAAMCLVQEARNMTCDIDAIYEPREEIRQIASEISFEKNWPMNWLNDAVEVFMQNDPPVREYRKFGSLVVFSVDPDYLLAMKLRSARGLGKDMEDISFLINKLGLNSGEEVLDILFNFFGPEEISVFTYQKIKSFFPEISFAKPADTPSEQPNNVFQEVITEYFYNLPKDYIDWILIDEKGNSAAHVAASLGLLSLEFDLWHLRDHLGMTVAHVAAQAGRLPKDFNKWELKDDRGSTVAHSAAQAGRLPNDFNKWELRDDRGRTVAEVAGGHASLPETALNQKNVLESCELHCAEDLKIEEELQPINKPGGSQKPFS